MNACIAPSDAGLEKETYCIAIVDTTIACSGSIKHDLETNDLSFDFAWYPLGCLTEGKGGRTMQAEV